MTIGEKIVQARQQQGLSQKQLAEKLEITAARLNYWEKDKRFPPIDMLNKLIELLSIDANFLLGRDNKKNNELCSNKHLLPEEFEHIKKYRTLDKYGKEMVSSALDIEFKRCQEQNKEEVSAPLADIIPLPRPWQSASAGYGQLADDSMADEIQVYLNTTTAKASYIMKVCGDSMEPIFFDGQEFLVHEQQTIELGEIGIFIIGGEQFIKTYRGDHLESANPNYPNVQFDEYSKCIGKVLGLLKNEWIADNG